MNLVGIQHPHLNNLFDFRDHQVSGGGHRLVKVILGHAVDEVTGPVGLPGADQRDITAQRRLKNIRLAVNDLGLPPRGQHGASPRWRVKAAESGATGANCLGQGALGQQLKFNRPRLRRGHCLAVAGKKGANRFLDLAITQQATAAQPRFAHIVGDIGQLVDAKVGDGVEQMYGIAGHAKAADEDGIA